MQQQDRLVVLITGASGFIGSYLVDFLLQQNYAIVAFSRQAQSQQVKPYLTWISDFAEIQHHHIDYVINLAGENIGQSRWTAQRKAQLIRSRVDTTEQLYRALQQYNLQPRCILNGSAIGYYGIDVTEQWQHVCDEQALAQTIFMSELCQKWEAVAQKFPQQHSKTLRLGVVFAAQGGILAQMLTPIRWNLIKHMGTGRQPLVWVHIADVLAVIHYLMLTPTSQHIFNVVAPEKTSQADFVQRACQYLHKKPLFNLPKALLNALLGEQAQLVLNGQYVHPQALLEMGYQFKFPTLEMALEDLLRD